MGLALDKKKENFRWLIIGTICCGSFLMSCENSDKCDFNICNASKRSCIEKTAEAMACMREEEPIKLEYDYRTVAYFEEKYKEMYKKPDQGAIDRTNLIYRGKSLLGILPEGYSYSWTEDVSLSYPKAFYAPETKTMVVVKDSDAFSRETNFYILVVNLVEAYQDRKWDITALKERHESTRDRKLALKAVLSGESDFVIDLVSEQIEGEVTTDDERRKSARRSEQYALDELGYEHNNTDDVAYGFLPHTFGAGFVVDCFLLNGWEGVKQILGNPPDSTRALMLGYENWMQNGPNLNKDEDLDYNAIPVLPERFALVNWEHLGVWYIKAMLEWTTGLDFRWNDLLYGIEADVLSTFWDKDADEVAVVWRIHGPETVEKIKTDLLFARVDSDWQYATDATEFSQFVVLEDAGEDLVLVATTGESALEIATRGLEWMSIGEASEILVESVK